MFFGSLRRTVALGTHALRACRLRAPPLLHSMRRSARIHFPPTSPAETGTPGCAASPGAPAPSHAETGTAAMEKPRFVPRQPRRNGYAWLKSVPSASPSSRRNRYACHRHGVSDARSIRESPRQPALRYPHNLPQPFRRNGYAPCSGAQSSDPVVPRIQGRRNRYASAHIFLAPLPQKRVRTGGSPSLLSACREALPSFPSQKQVR